MRPDYGSQPDVIMQTRKPDKLPHIFFISSPGFEIGDVRQPFILRRNIGELLELGARKIAFFERNEVDPPPLLKHENAFCRVKKGDLFFELFV
jgi:hypothetical protein